MFLARQLLGLATLLDGITHEGDIQLQDALLCIFSASLELNNQFCRYMAARKSAGGQTVQGVFARHDYQPKLTVTENNILGLPALAMGSFLAKFGLYCEALKYRDHCWDFQDGQGKKKREKVQVDKMPAFLGTLLCQNSAMLSEAMDVETCTTDPPYVGNVNYAELSDFFYIWLRLALQHRYPQFAPEYTPKSNEIVENRTRGKSRQDFYQDLSGAFSWFGKGLTSDGLLVFTFHHTDQQGTVWEGLLQCLCNSGFEVLAVYPIHGESESSLHLMDKENVSYDLIHVCRKRRSMPEKRSWAGIRQEVRRQARAELEAIEEGRYGKEPLLPADVRLICIGKCLQLYSAHYGGVLDHEGNPLSLHHALQDIGTMVDQLVTREKPLPSELEDVDPISYAWFRVLMKIRREVKVDEVNKAIRAMQVNAEDLKRAGLLVRGRTYEVKQPAERLNTLLEKLKAPETPGGIQGSLFDDTGDPVVRELRLVDLIHLLIGLAEGGQSVAPWLERFSGERPRVRAALRFIQEARPDWQGPIDRILPLVDELALFWQAEGG